MPYHYSRTKHLDYITTAIERMARNSFMCKAWAITLTVAILAFNVKNNISEYAPVVAIIALLSLWWLDAFYLRLERLFRKLYEDVRKNDFSNDQYTMNIAPYKDKVPSAVGIMFTGSELPLYIPTLLAAMAASWPVITCFWTNTFCK